MNFTEILVTPDGETTKGILKEDALFWWEQGKQKSMFLADVVGVSKIVHQETSPPTPGIFKERGVNLDLKNTSKGFVISAYLGKGGKRKLQKYYFLAVDEDGRSRWLEAINQSLGHISKRRLLVVINPTSGKKKAVSVWQQVSVLFDASYISYQVVIPEGVEHLKEIINRLDTSHIDGVVIIGGDGTVYEVINGLFKADKKLPVGIIPGGTGNGLCKSLLEMSGEAYEAINAAFLVAKGKLKRIDMVLTTQGHRQYYSVLSLSWGLVSDVDIESDGLRFLGGLKNDLYALLRIINLRYYPGRLSFIPPDQDTWQVIEDDFVLVWAMNAKWAAYNMMVAPGGSLTNGEMDILVVRRGVSLWQLLWAFLLMGEGKHLELSVIECYKAKSLKLEPLSSRGILAVDGEQVEYEAIAMEVMKDFAEVY